MAERSAGHLARSPALDLPVSPYAGSLRSRGSSRATKSAARATVPPYEAAKRLIDVLGASALALAALPLIVVILPAMLCAGRPVVFAHRRVGKGGRLFDCLKLRTMDTHAEEALRELLDRDPLIRAEWERHRKLRHDPRVTPLGRLLRRTSLDELPQLWNVVRGEMSLVGPRPVVHEELLRYGPDAPAYLSGRPGITGLWQVRGRNDANYRRRVKLDAYYARHRSLRLDLRILLATARVVLRGAGAY